MSAVTAAKANQVYLRLFGDETEDHRAQAEQIEAEQEEKASGVRGFVLKVLSILWWPFKQMLKATKWAATKAGIALNWVGYYIPGLNHMGSYAKWYVLGMTLVFSVIGAVTFAAAFMPSVVVGTLAAIAGIFVGPVMIWASIFMSPTALLLVAIDLVFFTLIINAIMAAYTWITAPEEVRSLGIMSSFWGYGTGKRIRDRYSEESAEIYRNTVIYKFGDSYNAAEEMREKGYSAPGLRMNRWTWMKSDKKDKPSPPSTQTSSSSGEEADPNESTAENPPGDETQEFTAEELNIQTGSQLDKK